MTPQHSPEETPCPRCGVEHRREQLTRNKGVV